MNIIYMGTPDFAVPALRRLIESAHEVSLVVTQPDKPAGRRQVLTPPPVKELAAANSIEVFQPASLKTPEAFDVISALAPELIVVAAYGKILPKAILEIPKYGCINLHGSILPKYRGSAPIQWAVINGESETGITAMQMDEGIDTGDILLMEKTKIGENETAHELFDRLADMCPGVLAKTLELLEAGELRRTPQDNASATYAPLLRKEMSFIDWNLSSLEIHNKIRGLYSWPIAMCEVTGKRIKLLNSIKTDRREERKDSVFFAEKEGLFAVCGDGGVLFLPEVQPEGGKRMSSSDFVRGHFK